MLTFLQQEVSRHSRWLRSVRITKFYSGDQIQYNETDGANSRYRGEEM